MRLCLAALTAFALGWLVRHASDRPAVCEDLSEVWTTLSACERTIRECARAVNVDGREIVAAEGWFLNPEF